MHYHVYFLTLIAVLSIMLFFNLFARWMATTRLFQPRGPDTKISRQPLLRLNANNEFHIAIFSDLHYGEEEDGWGIDQDVNSTRAMNHILDSEDPDFVILSLYPYSNSNHVSNIKQMEI
jgi:hypothetical protein